MIRPSCPMPTGWIRVFPSLSLFAGFLLVWSCIGGPAVAQSVGAAPADTVAPLGEALDRLATHAELSLVYDAKLVQGYYTDCPIRALPSPEATLRCVLRDTDLDFVQTSGGTYVVKTDVRRPSRHGSVTGLVKRAARDAPLANAHVEVRSGPTGTATDQNGRFRLSELVAGTHTLVVSHIGYETKTVEIQVPPGGTTRHTFTLTSTSIALDSVLVNAPEVPPLPPSRRHARLSPEQLQRISTAGTPSVAHAAGQLLGVTTDAPYADLHMQGSASSAHEVRLDGVPVRNPAATGRLLGAFTPMALDGIVAHKAGFGPLRGDALSGILQLEHDLQQSDTRYATVQADPVSLSGRTEGTIALGRSSTQAMAAARIGTWGVHQSYALSQIIDTWSVLDPVLTAAQLSADSLITGGLTNQHAQPRSQFYDLHGAARTEFGAGRSLYASAYHGHSVLGAHLTSSSNVSPSTGTESIEIPTSDQYGWTNTTAQATYASPLTARTTGRLQASLSHYRAESHFDLGELSLPSNHPLLSTLASVQGPSTSNAVTEMGLEGTLDIRLSEEEMLTLQGDFTSLRSRFHLTNAFVGRVRSTARSTRLAAAGQVELGLGRFTTIRGGVRLTSLPERSALFIEPRAALRYHRTDTGIGDVAARIGGGLYRKYTSQFEVARDGTTAVVPTTKVWMPVPSTHQPPQAYHLSSSLTWAPHPAWSTTLEGYGKWKPHLLAVNYPSLQSETATNARSPSDLLSASRGHAYGGGLRLSYEGAWGRGTLRYAYSHSRRTFPGRFGGRLVPTPWNEPHRLMLNTHLPLGNVLTVALKYTGTWGRHWGYQRAYYAYLDDGNDIGGGTPPDWNHPERHRLPPLHRVDATLTASHSWGDVAVSGQIGLVNVLDHENVADWGLEPTGEPAELTRRSRLLPGRRAVLSLEVTY